MNEEERRLFERAEEEKKRAHGYVISVYLDLTSVLHLVSALQWGLKSCGLSDTIADTAGRFIDGTVTDLRMHGLEAHAELIESSNQPQPQPKTAAAEGPYQ